MRDDILNLLEHEYSALDLISINDKLGLSTVDELKTLEYELDLLVKENIVYYTNKHKYILYTKCPDFKVGRMQINKSGNGFVCLEDEDDIFIDFKNVNYALNGDTVLAKIVDVKKREGIIISILKRDINNIVGLIKSRGNKLYFEPKDNVNISLNIDKESLKKCVEGEIVVVSITGDLGKNKYKAIVSRHICHKDDAKMDILSIAAKYDIYQDFSDDVMNEANGLPDDVSGDLLESEKRIRKDLTSEIIFTIDGEDTKDIDDAISLTHENGFDILKVSIADVSHYVKENSFLDKEAYNRGTSSYLAYAVLPMLPHKLSNGICSLNPNVIRCALTCEMKLNNNGIVVDSNIYPSLIESKKKMTYTCVNQIIEEDIIPDGYQEFADILKNMNNLAKKIRNNRTRRGASDFDIPEGKIICDDAGVAVDVCVRERGDAERMIEDFMVVANEAVASTLYNLDLPAIYRVHDKPSPERIQNFISFCSSIGYKIKGKYDEIKNPKMFQSLLSQVKAEGIKANIIKSLAVRSMPKAYYSKDNIGHFGLAVILPSTSYTHFTSPIRRYPDLITHRLIWCYLINKNIDNKTLEYWNSSLDEIAAQASKREIAAIEAEREVFKMKSCEYMEKHINEESDAYVSGVTGYGLFVQLPNLVEGLIPLESLDGSSFVYNESLQALIDKNTKKKYVIGDKLRVRCISASKVAMKIDFEEVRENDRNTK